MFLKLNKDFISCLRLKEYLYFTMVCGFNIISPIRADLLITHECRNVQSLLYTSRIYLCLASFAMNSECVSFLKKTVHQSRPYKLKSDIWGKETVCCMVSTRLILSSFGSIVKRKLFSSD